jgi:hypothetical protein
MAEVDGTKVLNKPQSMPIAISEAQCNYSKYILLLLITGGGHFRITMTVDKDIMEFAKKGLGNSEKVMDFLALEVYRPWKLHTVYKSKIQKFGQIFREFVKISRS